jgi:hypothetical protein
MNLAYSIIQWLLTLFFGPLLAWLYSIVIGEGSFGSLWGIGLYLIVLITSFFFSIPSLMLHLLFCWLFYKYHFNRFFIKSALILLTVMLILVSLVGFSDMDLDGPLVIGYCLAAVLSGIFLPVVEN